MQETPPNELSSPQPQQQGAAAPSTSAAAAAAEGIELKPASANVLLGQQHLESRGKFVAAHPVARPVPANYNQQSYHHQPGSAGGSAVRRTVSPLGQQQVAVADEPAAG